MSGVILYLDNYQYYPGNAVRGKAVCNFRSSKEVRKVRIRLEGEESTRWTGTETYYDSIDKKQKTRSVTYTGHHYLLLRDTIVHGEGEMHAGEHVFPFEFVLPEDLPGSFQHSYGTIRFSVKVTVDRPWTTDFEDEKEIILISPIKLQRLSPTLQEPAEYSDEKTVCCFCCASGPIQLDVSLEKRAFLVGETAGIRVYCMNMSNVNVDSLDTEIKTKLRFKVTHPSTEHKYDSELVCASHNSGVGAHGDKTYNMGLDIPSSTVIPNFNGCELFSCDTPLKVTAAISGCHANIDISTDIAIGHVPYPQAPELSGQYLQSAPPYPIIDLPDSICGQPSNGFQPMPMPMPGDAKGLPPYPVPEYPSGPSAPQQSMAPSAPPKLELSGNPSNSGAAFELPPPTYDEAAKNFK